MNCYIGQIVLLAFGFTPLGFLPCQGQTLSIDKYPTLFSIIGGAYGGDWKTSFRLPDTSGMPVAQGFHHAICVEGIFPSRQ